MNRLELFKPLMKLKDKMNPILFDEIGLSYGEFYSNKDLRPFIIFYDESDDTYWYIKSRNALKTNKKYKKKYKGEILIKEADIGLFEKESYIDCSQVFKIDAALLELLVDKDADLYNKTSVLNKNQQKVILNKINDCVNEDPPYLSIIKVDKIDNKIKGTSLYLCPEKFKILEERSKREVWKGLALKSLYNAEIELYGEEYLTAMHFKKKIQEKYFPNRSFKMKM